MFLKTCLSAIVSNAKCESNHSIDNDTKYNEFIEPKLASFITPSNPIKSRYNFLHDSLPYRTTNKKQLTLYDNYMNDVLSMNNIDKSWRSIGKCLKNDKNDPSKQLLCKALVTDYYIANENFYSAQKTITKAYHSFKKYNDLSKHHREELYVRAFYEFVINYDKKESAKIFKYISAKYPFDLYSAKKAMEIWFDLDAFLEIKEYHDVNGDKNPLRIDGNRVPSAYFNGLLSNYLVMDNLLDQAEQCAIDGLRYHIDDNWLHHGLIHSRYFKKNSVNDYKELIEYLETKSASYWDHTKMGFITSHNWWHIGLLYLELDDIDAAMDVFKTNVWRNGNNLDKKVDQIAALSIFWILTMIIDTKNENGKYSKYIEQIGNEWQIMMDYVFKTHRYNGVSAGFTLYDVLFIRGIIEMKKRYHKSGDHTKYKQFDECFNHFTKEMIGLNPSVNKIIDAMVLMYGENTNKENKNEAYKIFAEIIDNLYFIGGSREQRFVFDEMYIDILIKNNLKKELKQFLKSFISKYPLRSLSVVATNQNIKL